jgi:hypothetical protein
MMAKLVQLIVVPEDGGFFALDSEGRVWQSEGIASDRLSRPMVEWTPVRALFHELAPGDS